ncbi:MAG: aminopeptidase [Desulfobacterales bacterium]|nr:aminopeptidase [Desulfobacterales bacterium]
MDKDQVDNLRKNIQKKSSLIWDVLSEIEISEVLKMGEEYKSFLDSSKTEREAVITILDKAKQKGFKEQKHQKIYQIHRNKCMALAVIGDTPITDGINIIAAHIDSPRIDFKQNPIYEEDNLVLSKTHYYGGIRKYHWLARPLAIHGRLILKDGKEVDIVIGEKIDDPVFTIADLLPHLSRKLQDDKKLSEAFEGEKLNIIMGSIPIAKDIEIKDRFKLSILNYFYEKFGIIEEDFVSAEIEIVPAEKARDVGIDRSMIGGYGQDDRICAFTLLDSILSVEKPKKTAVAIFVDKEEIGSEGNTGAKSRFMEDFIANLFMHAGIQVSENILRKTLMNSLAISADVNGALDPDYQEVHDKKNAAKLGYGVCITKYTGSGGKSGASDASAEYMGKIRKIFNDNNIIWQAAGLGKVDQGGGGTIAKFLAEYGMEVVDIGPSLLSMHSPFEISSKADLYMTAKAYKAFYKL